MNILVLAFGLVFACALFLMHRRNHGKVINIRQSLLDDCRALLQNPTVSYDAAGFAKLEGGYAGYAVALTLEPDNIAMRKLPSLWLHVSVTGNRIAGLGSLDILARPQNIEFYSPSWDWERRVESLPGWPEHANYSTDSHPPDLHRMDDVVKTVFADAHTKELLVTPDRVRVTYQVKQADRGEYLLMRTTVFDPEPVPSHLARDLLNHVLNLRQTFEAGVIA